MEDLSNNPAQDFKAPFSFSSENAGETTNAEDASAKLRADVDDLQQTLARNAATSATLERRVQLGVQEREGLLKLLESYREEASRDPSVQGGPDWHAGT